MGIPKKAIQDNQFRKEEEEKEPPVKKPKRAKKRPPKPKKQKQEPIPESDDVSVDKETGLKYKTLPKSEYDSEGTPILQVDDLDLHDLGGEADKFLPHLRQAPDRKEMKRLRAEQTRRALQREKQYYKEHGLDEKGNPIPDNNDGDENED